MVLIDSLDLQDHQLAKAVVQAQDGAFQFEICEEQWPQQHKSRKEVLTQADPVYTSAGRGFRAPLADGMHAQALFVVWCLESGHSTQVHRGQSVRLSSTGSLQGLLG